METRSPLPWSELSTPLRHAQRPHSGSLRLRSSFAETALPHETRPPPRLQPLPSHRRDVVKIQREIRNYEGKKAAVQPSPSMLRISMQMSHILSHPDRMQLTVTHPTNMWTDRLTRSKDVTPCHSPCGSKEVSPARKFNSPYAEVELRQDSAAILTQMSSALKQSSQLTEEEFSRTDSVPKYHEFKFKLMTDDPLTQGVNRTAVRWKAGETLGQGTLGQVIRAFNVATGEIFAVKRLLYNPDNTSQAEFVKQLEVEVRILSRLSHPNIVQYRGSELLGESHCTYLEYVSGGSIAHLLSRLGPLPETVVKQYLTQVVQGLNYLHQQGVVHRDLKCGNLLVDNEGEIKLADFGCAVKYDGSAQQSNLLTSLKGSILWMAPEVLRQSGYGRKADIWSLGCCGAEMLTGRPPWPSFDDALQAIMHIGLSTASPSLPQNVSSAASDFLSACLQRDPKARPSAAELLVHPFLCTSEQA